MSDNPKPAAEWAPAIAAGILSAGLFGAFASAGSARRKTPLDSPLTPEEEAARLGMLAEFYRREASEAGFAADDLERKAKEQRRWAAMMALEARSVNQAFAAHVATLTGTAECAACHEPVVKSALVGWGTDRLTCADGAACGDAQRKAEEARRAAKSAAPGPAAPGACAGPGCPVDSRASLTASSVGSVAAPAYRGRRREL